MVRVTDIDRVKNYLLELQSRICTMLTDEDGSVTFNLDRWDREEGGGGITRALESGAVLEKAAVNFSHVFGLHLPAGALQGRAALLSDFQAMGISVIVHPLNPYVPTTHMNVRVFTAEKKGVGPVWWFGGGFDLTPYYGFSEDCRWWHEMASRACEGFGDGVYTRFKRWADEYFYLPHRHECRGIGGLFFDELNEWGFDRSFDFMRSVGDHFGVAYRALLAKRKDMTYGKRERDFQCYRRGRYVEFNLLYDRGTLFGLQSNGRVESILASLPPHVMWHYNWKPMPGTPEALLTEYFLKPRDWLVVVDV